jgi:hypothetical protein
MTRAGRSVFLFGWYLVVIGALAAVTPNLLLRPLGLPSTDEPWLRILGTVLVALAGYYLVCGRRDDLLFARLTIFARLFVSAGLVLVAVIYGHWQIALFAIPDTAGALWTASTLRASSPSPV